MYKNRLFRTTDKDTRGKSTPDRRNNGKFLDCYLETDGLCALKFGVAIGGVTEYINRLDSLRYIKGRDEVLPKLVRYRDFRNKIAHEAGALSSDIGVTKSDIKWLKRFNRDLYRKRDPITVYLRRERKMMRRKMIRRCAFGLALGTIAVLAFALWAVLEKF